MDREIINYDVVITGGGPSGLSAAIRLKQLSESKRFPLSVCLLEKGAEIGSHILSGAVIDPIALNELIPGWKGHKPPLTVRSTEEEFYLFRSESSAVKIPHLLIPPLMRNRGNYIASLGNLCRWLADEAKTLGVEIFPGFPAASILYDGNNTVCGVATADLGIDSEGRHKPGFTQGVDIHAKYVILAEGSRGHLGKELISRYSLDKSADPQHYAIGLKERWQIEPGRRRPGKILHGAGWPLSREASGGSFLYHLENGEIVIGLIVDLDYRNPFLDPFSEFQRMKHHPVYHYYIEGGKRTGFGARSISKGGYNSLPKMSAPGALLVGCDAGTLNLGKIKGIHTAMKSGMVAAETLFEHLYQGGDPGADLAGFNERFMHSWAGRELHRSRNSGPALKHFGTLAGSAFNFLDQTFLRGRLPMTLHHRRADHACLDKSAGSSRINYTKPDNRISFDRNSSVYLTHISHDNNQPCHLKLHDPALPVKVNALDYAGVESRFCPAGVYEYTGTGTEQAFQINAQNYIHCKTCDIKDPAQNITWVPPEAGSGPNYSGM